MKIVVRLHDADTNGDGMRSTYFAETSVQPLIKGGVKIDRPFDTPSERNLHIDGVRDAAMAAGFQVEILDQSSGRSR
jgi:hypothetical protein